MIAIAKDDSRARRTKPRAPTFEQLLPTKAYAMPTASMLSKLQQDLETLR